MLKKNCQGKIHPQVAQLGVPGRVGLAGRVQAALVWAALPWYPGSCRRHAQGQQRAHGVFLLLVPRRVSLQKGRYRPLSL